MDHYIVLEVIYMIPFFTEKSTLDLKFAKKKSFKIEKKSQQGYWWLSYLFLLFVIFSDSVFRWDYLKKGCLQNSSIIIVGKNSRWQRNSFVLFRSEKYLTLPNLLLFSHTFSRPMKYFLRLMAWKNTFWNAKNWTVFMYLDFFISLVSKTV